MIDEELKLLKARGGIFLRKQNAWRNLSSKQGTTQLRSETKEQAVFADSVLRKEEAWLVCSVRIVGSVRSAWPRRKEQARRSTPMPHRGIRDKVNTTHGITTLERCSNKLGSFSKCGFNWSKRRSCKSHAESSATSTQSSGYSSRKLLTKLWLAVSQRLK